MSIENTLDYIHKTKWLGSKPGLSRTNELLDKIGRPDKRLRFVHVAGTNGKGSTCACIASILQSAGYRVGLYTSPFITVFNERMRVNGVNISDAELEEITDFIKPFADSMTDNPPTEFELITVIALEYFARKKCDIVVLEVGMGGELDSTNVIDSPECAVICAIGLDHTIFLGDTVEKIALAKAGIIKSGTSVAVYDEKDSVMRVFEDKCRECGASLAKADFSKLSDEQCDLDVCRFSYGKYKNLSLHLAGTYQPKNAAVAILACEKLCKKGWKISEQNIYDGLSNVKWQGRFEVLGKDPVFILDGAHNPHGMRATSQSFYDHFGTAKIHFLVGAMADKDVESMMKMLLPLSYDFVTVRPDNDRAMSAEGLCELLTRLGAKAAPSESVADGVRTVLSNCESGGICAALGSLYFSGDVRKAYGEIKNEH